MQKLWQIITAIPGIKQLNQYKFMPIIWCTILLAIFPYILSLIKLPIVWRMSVFYLIINSIVSYYLGKFIQKRRISKWWIFLLPIVFDLAIIIKFAPYNLFLGLVYIIFEIFGLFGNRIYR